MSSYITLMSLFFIYTAFNLLTLHSIVRIKDKVIPNWIYGMYTYFLSLFAYTIYLTTPNMPFKSIILLFQILIFGLIEAAILYYSVKEEEKELLKI